jgi:hypothetical protein
MTETFENCNKDRKVMRHESRALSTTINIRGIAIIKDTPYLAAIQDNVEDKDSRYPCLPAGCGRR